MQALEGQRPESLPACKAAVVSGSDSSKRRAVLHPVLVVALWRLSILEIRVVAGLSKLLALVVHPWRVVVEWLSEGPPPAPAPSTA